MRFSKSTLAGLTLLSMIAAQPVQADDIQARLQKAQAAASQKDWDDALTELDAVIAIDKNNVTAHSGRALMLVQKKNIPDAITEVTRVIELDPKNAGAFKLRSDLYKQTGDNAKAKADFIACLRLAPEEATKLEEAAVAASKKEDWENAVNLWALMSDVHPGDAHILYERGMALKGAFYTVFLNNSGSPDFQEHMDKLKADTKASFDAAIKADPKFAAAYLAQDDIEVINQGLKVIPDNADLLVGHARKLLSSLPDNDMKKQALADCDHAIKTDPKNADAYGTRATANLFLKNYDAALADSAHSLELKPDNFEVLKLRGTIYNRKGDYTSEAAEDERALSIKSDDEIQFSCYLALTHLPDKTRAFTAIGKLIDKSPDSAIYRQSRAELYFDQKDYKSAKADIDKVLTAEPDNKDAIALRDKIAAAQK